MRLVSILLSIQLMTAGMLPNMDAHDLDSVTELVTHFAAHQNNGRAINLHDFVSAHYSDNDYAEGPGHDYLPFKHVHACGSLLAGLLNSFSFEFPDQDRQSQIIRVVAILFSTYFTSFWQPPPEA